ncbi:S100P-binding protein isoform X2 [Hippoglossus stenolepis]|uniref:S100P-binding protein isoform X2 n=1 Tax=Hippoglossus stenolepis TaxID=195615 RepID=UPI00159C7489|nr:S100P-binding protein isoform X2 [Hippoglossus stenolepis]
MDERMKGPFRSTVFRRLTPAIFDSFTDHCSPPLTVPLRSDHVEYGSSTGPGVDKRTVINSERVFLNEVSTFDCDVDNILCLNPVGVGGFSENVESRRSSDTFQNKPMLSSTWTSDGGSVAHHQELESGNEQVEDGRGGLKTELYLNVSDEDDDDGYFSMFHKRAKISPQSGHIQLSRATSSPQHWTDEVREPWDACHPESSSEQAAITSRHISFTVRDLCPTVSGPQLESANSDSLEGDSEEVWTIGRPMFESSMCHSVTVKLSAGSEQSRQVTEDVQHGVTEPVRDCQATVIRDTATVQSTDTSYEATLSPQVQVKSVVVALRQSTTSSSSTSSSSTSRSKTTARPVPELKDFHSNRYVLSGKRKRPEDMEVDWECKKQSYVHSVTKHMEEHPGTTQDVMTELFNLITHVAEKTRGGNGRQWQHPSDLTRREKAVIYNSSQM